VRKAEEDRQVAKAEREAALTALQADWEARAAAMVEKALAEAQVQHEEDARRLRVSSVDTALTPLL
jgi:hypothetical protein